MPFTFRHSDIPKLDLDVDHGSNFKAWLEEWLAYIAVSGLSEENGDTKYHVLRLAFSRETASVVDNLGLSEEDKKKIDKIIQCICNNLISEHRKHREVRKQELSRQKKGGWKTTDNTSCHRRWQNKEIQLYTVHVRMCTQSTA